MNSYLVMVLCIVMCIATIARAQKDAAGAQPPKPTNEADELDQIILHSFEHYDYLDILYKLKGHNSDTWIVLFYIDEDHHKEERDRLKKLIFKENPDFKFAEVNISKDNYSPIRQAIRFPQNANERDFPMVLIMKNQIGQMVYGPGVSRKAADVVVELKAAEEKKKQEEAAAANPPPAAK